MRVQKLGTAPLLTHHVGGKRTRLLSPKKPEGLTVKFNQARNKDLYVLLDEITRK
jgi:hypothetical protein